MIAVKTPASLLKKRRSKNPTDKPEALNAPLFLPRLCYNKWIYKLFIYKMIAQIRGSHSGRAVEQSETERVDKYYISFICDC